MDPSAQTLRCRRKLTPTKEERAEQKRRSKASRALAKKAEATKAGLVLRPVGRAPAGFKWDAQRGEWVSIVTDKPLHKSAIVEAGNLHTAAASALFDIAFEAWELQPPQYRSYAADRDAWHAAQDEWMEKLRGLKERANWKYHSWGMRHVNLVLPDGIAERAAAWKNALKVHARLCAVDDANRRAQEVARKRAFRQEECIAKHKDEKAAVPSDLLAAVHEVWDRKAIINKRVAVTELQRGSHEADSSEVVTAVKVARYERQEAGKPPPAAIKAYATLMKWDTRISTSGSGHASKHSSADYRTSIYVRAARRLESLSREDLERLARLFKPIEFRKALEWERLRAQLSSDMISAASDTVSATVDPAYLPGRHLNIPFSTYEELLAASTEREKLHPRPASPTFSACPFTGIRWGYTRRLRDLFPVHETGQNIWMRDSNALNALHDALPCLNASACNRGPPRSVRKPLCKQCVAELSAMKHLVKDLITDGE